LARREVWITGVGVVLPGCIGIEAFRRHLAEAEKPSLAGPVAEADLLPHLNARRARRLSDYVKLTLAAANLAMADAGLDDDAEAEAREAFTAECAGLLGTAHGSTHYSYDYYRGLVDEGLATANPMLFAQGVPNAGAAHLSMSLKLRGACQSIIGSWTAGLDALRLAALRLGDGTLDRCVVCAGEEHDELVERCYAELGLARPTMAAAVALVLESRTSAEARSARNRGVVESGASMHFNAQVRRGAAGLSRLLQAEAEAGAKRVVGPGDGAWLGRLVRVAERRSGVKVSSPPAGFAESFSAAPLLSLAAALVDPPGVGRVAQAPGSVVAGDVNGAWSVARIRRANDYNG
jgi:3-oxoacyl-[acyl-carrier-protein] synthase II